MFLFVVINNISLEKIVWYLSNISQTVSWKYYSRYCDQMKTPLQLIKKEITILYQLLQAHNDHLTANIKTQLLG